MVRSLGGLLGILDDVRIQAHARQRQGPTIPHSAKMHHSSVGLGVEKSVQVISPIVLSAPKGHHDKNTEDDDKRVHSLLFGLLSNAN